MSEINKMKKEHIARLEVLRDEFKVLYSSAYLRKEKARAAHFSKMVKLVESWIIEDNKNL